MIAEDEDALICDLAETYQIFDFESLPVKLVATLSVGLRDNSRIKMKINGLKLPLDTYLSGMAVDALNLLCWKDTKDAQKNINRPKSVIDALTKEEKNESVSLTMDDYETVRKRILARIRRKEAK